ncbi:MAG TPA: Holliday junction branch migration protein RuvA [Patescibacteria group bacterium]|nr:Holliday junction branch migration protein RuvA [Patescibacteria group bacterium]
MIGSLQGKVDLLDRPFVIVDVQGVGYKVLLSNHLFSKLKLGENLKVFTYTHVKEDALDLFGFEELEDLKLFENFLTVPGIGPKTAMNVFSFHKREDIVNAILTSDVSVFTSVPRLGTKNAQKIIIELKSKIGSTKELDLTGKEYEEQAEVINALKNFGFTTAEAQKALKEVKKDGMTTEQKIRFALKYLGAHH